MASKSAPLPEKVRSLEAMDVDSLMEMLCNRGIPADIIKKLRDEDLDGEAISDLTIENFKTCIPGISTGHANKVLRRRAEYLASPIKAGPPLDDSLETITDLDTHVSTPKRPHAVVPFRGPLMICEGEDELNLMLEPDLDSSEVPSIASTVTGVSDSSAPSTPPASVAAHHSFRPSVQSYSSARERREAAITSSQVRLHSQFPIHRCFFSEDAERIFATGKTTGLRTREGMRNILTSLRNVLVDMCGPYPHSEDVHEACHRLVTKVQGAQLNYPTELQAIQFWRRSLGQKLRNMRRPIPGDTNYQKDPIMSARARLGHRRADSVSHGKRKRAATKPEEHEDTYERLGTEMNRGIRNMKAVLGLMEKTFEGRQAEIGETRPHITDVLKRYPALRDVSVMKQELRLLTGVQWTDLELTSKLQAMAEVVLSRATDLSSRVHRDHPLRPILRREETSPETRVLKALMSLPYLLPSTVSKERTPHEYLVQVVPMNTPAQEICSAIPDLHTPFMVAVESHGRVHHYAIYSEHHHVVNLVSITDAVVATLCPTWLLDYQYDTRVKPVMQFLSAYLLNKHEKLVQVAEEMLVDLRMR